MPEDFTTQANGKKMLGKLEKWTLKNFKSEL